MISDRLRRALLDAEENEKSVFAIDQIGWALSLVHRAGKFDLGELVVMPRLAEQVDDCLKQDSSQMAYPQALLHLTDWMDREDRVGRVATALLRELSG